MEPPRHPVQRAKAPWTLKAETYLLPLQLPSLPPALYDPLESTWASPTHGTFTAGLGAIMIIRYTDTPVGPYDELMLIPGTFSVPHPSPGGAPAPPKIKIQIPKRALRIARIYVSQRTTAYNGRLNWNIPKHLARFEFDAPVTETGASPPGKLTVRVFAPGTQAGDGVPPFFACALVPWRWVPGVPVDMKYVPVSTMLVQPPVPEAAGHRRAVEAEVNDEVKIDAYDVSAKNEVGVAAGTDRWCAFDIGGKVGRARGCWVEVLRGETSGEEEGRYFPQGLKPWSVGGWMENAVLEIGEPLEWKL